MNRLKLHVIFILIRSDQQLSRIFPSLQKKISTSTQDHIATLKFKTADTPFQFQFKPNPHHCHFLLLHCHQTTLLPLTKLLHRHHFLMYHLPLLCLLG